jgi:MFS family permease
MAGLVIRLREATQGPAYRWWALAAVECGNFVVYLDGFIVTLVLPAMARHFGVGLHEIKWVVIAYLAALTVTLLLAGRLADLWGRKPVTVAGTALLTLGAALCALAPTLGALIAFRVLQGLGGANFRDLNDVSRVKDAIKPHLPRGSHDRDVSVRPSRRDLPAPAEASAFLGATRTPTSSRVRFHRSIATNGVPLGPSTSVPSPTSAPR